MSELLTTILFDVHSTQIVDLHKRSDFLNIKTIPGNSLMCTPIISSLFFSILSQLLFLEIEPEAKITVNSLFVRHNTIAIKVSKKRCEAKNGKTMQSDTFHRGISMRQLQEMSLGHTEGGCLVQSTEGKKREKICQILHIS